MVISRTNIYQKHVPSELAFTSLMAALGVARIPWQKWAKFILPVILVLWVAAAVFFKIGLSLYPA